MLTRAEVVEAIRENAQAWRAEADREDVSERDASGYVQDAIDLRMVADLVEEGCDEAAARWAYNLDTIVRDCMGGDVWVFLECAIGARGDCF